MSTSSLRTNSRNSSRCVVIWCRTRLGAWLVGCCGAWLQTISHSHLNRHACCALQVGAESLDDLPFVTYPDLVDCGLPSETARKVLAIIDGKVPTLSQPLQQVQSVNLPQVPVDEVRGRLGSTFPLQNRRLCIFVAFSTLARESLSTEFGLSIPLYCCSLA